MKILAPVSDYESAIRQIQAGADEIYLGGCTDKFDYFTYNARTKYSYDGKKTCASYEELVDIVNLAHERNVSVIYTANLLFLADDVEGTLKFQKGYLDYIDQGLKAGVDSVIVGDIGELLLLKQEGYQIPITSSTYFEVINQESLLFLKELGVSRAVLSYQIKREEVEKLAKLNIMQIEVFGHNGCSFYDTNCNMQYAPSCMLQYNLYDKNELISNGRILDANQYCSLCNLWRLNQAGVYAIKLVGREGNSEKNAQITKMYADVIKAIDKIDPINPNESIAEMKDSLIPLWWKRIYCKNELCRYKDNVVVKAFV